MGVDARVRATHFQPGQGLWLQLFGRGSIVAGGGFWVLHLRRCLLWGLKGVDMVVLGNGEPKESAKLSE